MVKFIYMLKIHLKQISKQGKTGLKRLNDSEAFIEYSNDMDGFYQSIEEYNPHKKSKLLIVLMI